MLVALPVLTLLAVASATTDACPGIDDLDTPEAFQGVLPTFGWTPSDASFLVVGGDEAPELLDAGTRDVVPSDVQPMRDGTDTIGWTLVPSDELPSTLLVLVDGERETMFPVDITADPPRPTAPRLTASRVPCTRALDLVVDGLPAESAVLEIEHGLTDDEAPARTLVAVPPRTSWALTVRGPDHWVRARVWSGAGRIGPWSETESLVEATSACAGCAAARGPSNVHLLVIGAAWLVASRRRARPTSA